jgi:hypothetical protein
MLDKGLILLAVVAAVASWDTGASALGVLNACAAIWSNGVSSNFGPGEGDQVPDAAALTAMITAVISIGLLVYSAL